MVCPTASHPTKSRLTKQQESFRTHTRFVRQMQWDRSQQGAVDRLESERRQAELPRSQRQVAGACSLRNLVHKTNIGIRSQLFKYRLRLRVLRNLNRVETQ